MFSLFKNINTNRSYDITRHVSDAVSKHIDETNISEKLYSSVAAL